MPEMRQCAADSYREIRPESRTAILGLLGVSQVPDDAELIDIRDSKESWSVPKYPSNTSTESHEQAVLELTERGHEILHTLCASDCNILL